MQVIIQAKLDGVSLCATYVDGKLNSLVTRGDGLIGDDITSHAEHMNNVPLTINKSGVVHVRGEGIMYESDFEQHFKSNGFKNARNTVSGMLKGRDTKQLKYVRFVAYEYYGPDREEYRYESAHVTTLMSLGFEVPQLCQVVDNLDAAKNVYTQYDERGGREALPYKTDGLVLKVNDTQLHGKLPTVAGGRPGHATAIKPTPKAAVTKVLSVIWSMGLSGRFTPVAQLEPADLDGVTLRQVNLHNLSYLREWVGKGFGVGAKVVVIRSGDVIPYLTQVLEPASK